jgi:putative endonuclease
MEQYFVYILTNKNKKVLYVGFTNNLQMRLFQHVSKFDPYSFTAKYNCHYLVYYEMHHDPTQGILREKELKGWKREKKIAMIEQFNPTWRFLNDDVLGSSDNIGAAC